MRAYRDQIFVIKLGGEVLERAEALAGVAASCRCCRRWGVRLVIVHGGGPQASQLSRKLGSEPQIIAGRRITDDTALSAVVMAVSGQLNVSVLSALRAHHVRAVGLSGVDGELLTAHRRPPVEVVDDAGVTQVVDFGHVGDIDRVDPRASSRRCFRRAMCRWSRPWPATIRAHLQHQRRHPGREPGRRAAGPADLYDRRPGAARSQRSGDAGHLRRSRRSFQPARQRRGSPAACALRSRACIRAATSGVERTPHHRRGRP